MSLIHTILLLFFSKVNFLELSREVFLEKFNGMTHLSALFSSIVVQDIAPTLIISSVIALFTISKKIQEMYYAHLKHKKEIEEIENRINELRKDDIKKIVTKAKNVKILLNKEDESI